MHLKYLLSIILIVALTSTQCNSLMYTNVNTYVNASCPGCSTACNVSSEHLYNGCITIDDGSIWEAGSCQSGFVQVEIDNNYICNPSSDYQWTDQNMNEYITQKCPGCANSCLSASSNNMYWTGCVQEEPSGNDTFYYPGSCNSGFQLANFNDGNYTCSPILQMFTGDVNAYVNASCPGCSTACNFSTEHIYNGCITVDDGSWEAGSCNPFFSLVEVSDNYFCQPTSAYQWTDQNMNEYITQKCPGCANSCLSASWNNMFWTGCVQEEPSGNETDYYPGSCNSGFQLVNFNSGNYTCNSIINQAVYLSM